MHVERCVIGAYHTKVQFFPGLFSNINELSSMLVPPTSSNQDTKILLSFQRSILISILVRLCTRLRTQFGPRLIESKKTL